VTRRDRELKSCRGLQNLGTLATKERLESIFSVVEFRTFNRVNIQGEILTPVKSTAKLPKTFKGQDLPLPHYKFL